MKIAYNPSGQSPLTIASTEIQSNDIIFDIPGSAIWARGYKFDGKSYNVFSKASEANSGGIDGLVPAPNYTTTAVRFLREDGSWVIPTYDDTKVTQTETDTNSNYEILFSGNANKLTETTTARKSEKLLFNPSNGTLSANTLHLNGDIVINDGNNNDRFIKFQYNNTDPYGWRFGYWGNNTTHGSDNNALVFESNTSGNWNTVLKLTHGTTTTATFLGTVSATTLKGNLDGKYINALTDYNKASSIAAITSTDSLNVALGKLEAKADYAYNWITDVTAADTDEYINKWGEIVDFLNSVKEETDILSEFVTRKTAQTITGRKTFAPTAGHSLFIRSYQEGTDYSSLTNVQSWVSIGMTCVKSTTVGTQTTYQEHTGYFVYKGNSDYALTNPSWSGGEYLILHAGNYSNYLPYLNSTTVHATNTSKIYAPTEVGTNGQILKSNGTGAPSWVNASTITAGSVSNKFTVKTSVNNTETQITEFDGSAAKTLKFVQDSNITLASTTNQITISAVDEKVKNTSIANNDNDKYYLLSTSTQNTTNTANSRNTIYMQGNELHSGNLWGINEISIEYTTITTEWMSSKIAFGGAVDGCTSYSLSGEGSYLVQLSNAKGGIWTGCFTLRQTSDPGATIIADEIVLQGGDSNTYMRPYLRILNKSNNAIELQIAYSQILDPAGSWTFKFKRLI